jgi:hypothetical protein
VTHGPAGLLMTTNVELGRARRYHSHPVFAPAPSQKDAENQRNYQALFRCPASGVEPFLGAIVGPWDLQLPSPVRASRRMWPSQCCAVTVVHICLVTHLVLAEKHLLRVPPGQQTCN